MFLVSKHKKLSTFKYKVEKDGGGPIHLKQPFLLYGLSTVPAHKDGTISIFHGCMMWIEKSVTRVTDRHREACRVKPNSDPE